MFDELYINDYCNFNTFKMVFPKENNNKECANLNLIVGKNGSGKSSLLDALFEIGAYNLNDNFQKIDNTRFEYKISNAGKIIITNMDIKNGEYYKDNEKKNFLWDAVIRLHTGHTARQFYSHSNNIYSLTTNTTKWALFAYIISGVWNHIYKCSKDAALWMDLQNTIFGKENHIKPQIIWVDVQKEPESNIVESSPIKDIRKPDGSIHIRKNIIRYFWNLDNPIIIKPPGLNITLDKTNPLPLLSMILDKTDPIKISNDLNGKYVDTGFLYTQGNSNKLYPDSFLSDGEHGFFTRFALLMLLREENKDKNKRYLILLDEPETHFNENWKTSFLNLICEIFEGTNHDVFIATHSAMLVTDAKDNEVHRLENLPSGIIHYPVPIKTYGANVIDIGRALFQMEADIGERSKNEIEEAIKANDKTRLQELLKQVGPGEWRWKIRSKINQLEKS